MLTLAGPSSSLDLSKPKAKFPPIFSNTDKLGESSGGKHSLEFSDTEPSQNKKPRNEGYTEMRSGIVKPTDPNITYESINISSLDKAQENWNAECERNLRTNEMKFIRGLDSTLDKLEQNPNGRLLHLITHPIEKKFVGHILANSSNPQIRRGIGVIGGLTNVVNTPEVRAEIKIMRDVLNSSIQLAKDNIEYKFDETNYIRKRWLAASYFHLISIDTTIGRNFNKRISFFIVNNNAKSHIISLMPADKQTDNQTYNSYTNQSKILQEVKRLNEER